MGALGVKLRDKSFRELRQQYIYLAMPELAAQLKNIFQQAQQATGVLCYCYLEHNKGLQLEVLCCAAFNAEQLSLKLFAGNKLKSVKLAYASVSEAEAALLPQGLPRLAEFKGKVAATNAFCAADAALEKTRQLTALDHLRKAGQPDDVLVHLVHGENVEKVYVRLTAVNELQLYGILVSEPQGDFAVHAGEQLSFYLVKNAQGIMCLALV